MRTEEDSAFLSRMPRFSDFDGVADFVHYMPLPGGWALAMADIVDSTGAIAAGKYKSVNMAGASVITAVLNALDQLDLPFAFGGDGAFVAVPPTGIEAARDALSRVRTWVEREFALDMRAAVVPVEDIRAVGLDVRVAHFQASTEISYAMFTGDGARWAEDEMKNGTYRIEKAPAGREPNLFGLSCGWDPVTSRNGQIVSIIAVPSDQGFGERFQALISDILSLVGESDRAGHPIPAEGPQPTISMKGYKAEALTQPSKVRRVADRLGVAAISLMLIVLRRFNWKLGNFDIRLYARDLAANTDFRKFDDALKMTVDLNAEQLAQIESTLEQATRDGICRFGLHTQDTALVTCIVPSPMTRDHMHFVDGAAGGYAEAANKLKQKLAAT
ncbi:DUF3095 domain-containing protein [Aliiroseovarius sp. YM-037]|uniref:DUF3095 domain-containing protein n=1 Tax=Aliiroseovarius sp. YM-037 TaxID=3341728 RepID=UPI003A7FE495